MSTRHREFTSARAEALGDPIMFSLDGEWFTVGGVESGPVLDLVAALPAGLDTTEMTPGDATTMLPALAAFVEGIVVDEDRERWHKAMRATSPQTLMQIVAYVIEESTGRPLAGSGESQPSRSPDGAPSSSASPETDSETPSP